MQEERMPLVLLEGVSKTYAGITVLTEASLAINAGEVHALVGENGAGKSTLMKILSGVETPDPGAQRTYFGREVESIDPVETLRLGVSVIYQDLSLFPNLSVAENLGFAPARAHGLLFRPALWQARAAELLHRVRLDCSASTLVEELSFAKQQMLAIARAIATQARVVVMDEPTSALSVAETAVLFEIINELRNDGVGIVFISHKLDEIFEIADRISVLRDGRVVASGPIGDFTEATLITAMVGRNTEYEVARVESTPGVPVLEVEDLVVDGAAGGVSFQVREREIVALTGLVGSGRTELAHAIFGQRPARTGRIRVEGVDVRVKSPDRAVKLGIGYVPEDRRGQGVFPRHSVRSNITVAALDRLTDGFRRILRQRESGLAEGYIADLDIRPARVDVSADTLSGGNQQKVMLARWMAAQPRLLIVDEPTNGIDIGAKREIHQLLKQLAASGTAVLVISSELPEVLAIANRILIMRAGRIVAETTPQESTQESILAIELAGDDR